MGAVYDYDESNILTFKKKKKKTWVWLLDFFFKLPYQAALKFPGVSESWAQISFHPPLSLYI